MIGYTRNMTITSPEPGTVMGQVLTPPISAYAGPVASAVFGFAQVVKDLIHASPLYKSEGDVLAALNAVDSLVKAFAKPSEIRALSTGDERAAMEDVTQRVPPNQAYAPGPVVNQVIDYNKLAAAIVQQQMAMRNAQEVAQDN